MGGAHVDRTVNDELLKPHNQAILWAGLTSADKAIFDTAKAAIKLIDLIEKYKSDQKETDFIRKVT